jgi:undecaprenyl diphosphate synthase
VAVIMDGNGRWAAGQGRRRSEGHAAGVAAIHGLIRAFRRLRIPHLTLYAFSAQNWGRPAEEVRALMALLGDFVATDLAELCANGVRLLVNGDVARLPAGVRGGLARMVAASARNTALTLGLALSYGGREEIVGAAQSAARAARAGLLDVDSLTPDSFRGFLPHPGVPDPDLLVRTSGEMRVSNFLLWQIAYSEIHVTGALWPEFGEGELLAALLAYARRERRFGKTAEQVAEEAAAAAAAAAGAAGGDKQAVAARLLAAAAPGQAGADAAADAASSSSSSSAGAMTAAQAADFTSSSAGQGRSGSGAPAWVPEAALGVALWLAAARSGCCQRQPQHHLHRRRALRPPPASLAQHSPPSALRCLLCTLAPCVSLAVALLGLVRLAPLALRLGLLQSPGAGAGAGGAAWLGSGEPACAAPLPPAPAAAAAEPCVFVLIDAATCSGGKRLVGKAVGWALRLRDVLVPAGLR